MIIQYENNLFSFSPISQETRRHSISLTPLHDLSHLISVGIRYKHKLYATQCMPAHTFCVLTFSCEMLNRIYNKSQNGCWIPIVLPIYHSHLIFLTSVCSRLSLRLRTTTSIAFSYLVSVAWATFLWCPTKQF